MLVPAEDSQIVKKQKIRDNEVSDLTVPLGRKRTSKLSAPTLLLSGHEGEIFTCKFSRDGETLASGSHDKRIFLWRVYGESDNFSVLFGHNNAVLELQWSCDDAQIFSCSPDKTVQIWDVESLTRQKKISAHDAIVNTIATTRRGSSLLASGADDKTSKVWDLRSLRHPTYTLEGSYPVTSLSFSDQSDQLFACDVAGNIEVWELRKEAVLYTMQGHMDVITGCALSPDGNFLLSNSMDNTLRSWDVRPFVEGGDSQRCTKMFTGHAHGVDRNLLRCSWSPDGSMVAAGSSDSPTHVYIWDFSSKKLAYQLPGHRAAVNEVSFHPKEPIVVSCSSDKTMFMGELGQ
eukprot:NODE_2217_length_1261_cov_17.958746_g2018_i0.p1 GENE.NODE_2217_length_1261_cov_17.958746_g2018_i0~~NODE_2217_length_1261_cov_17.958746_g2018_i0.p1  ORF type:complete len:346 (+),score=33.64 NODE_2217_length_1261_cov_17.958746_g2018_i0:25-1062(+)